MTAQKNRPLLNLRRRSASPRGILLNGDGDSQCATARPTVHFQADTDPERDLKVTRQANALARMSMELSIHDMNRRLTNLQEDVKTQSTNHIETRSNWTRHDTEIGELRQEMAEMKDTMKRILSVNHEENCQKRNNELSKLLSELRSEVEVVKSLAVENKSMLDKHQQQTQAIEPLKVMTEVENQSKQPTPTDRIKETLQSTRRWNRDRKESTLGEGAFVASYLKQQSKRDPMMTSFLQKALKTRVSTRKKRPKSYVYTAEAFYHDVVWADVKFVIEGELVKDTSRVMKVLV